MSGRDGRKPKPTALRLIQGNQEHRPLPENEPEPKAVVGSVEPPEWLGATARSFWPGFVSELQEMGVLTSADLPALALLCDSYAEHVECSRVIESEGRTYEATTAAGAVMVRPRPEAAMRDAAERRARAMLVEFGLTASSRTRVHALKAKPENKLDKYINRRRKGF